LVVFSLPFPLWGCSSMQYYTVNRGRLPCVAILSFSTPLTACRDFFLSCSFPWCPPFYIKRSFDHSMLRWPSLRRSVSIRLFSLFHFLLLLNLISSRHHFPQSRLGVLSAKNCLADLLFSWIVRVHVGSSFFPYLFRPLATSYIRTTSSRPLPFRVLPPSPLQTERSHPCPTFLYLSFLYLSTSKV